MPATPDQIKAGTAAALKLIQQDVAQFVPGWVRGMIPEDKEPVLAEQLTKVILAAVIK